MRFIAKQILSLILPFTVLILVPVWIEKDLFPNNSFALITGIIWMGFGVSLMTVCILLFIRIGKGTLAPWTPTRKFVITGPYRYVRNPMIIGVLMVLIGETIAFLSFSILIWTVTFFIINNVYFILYEEPDLLRKYGKEYQEYKIHVPRWIPRFRPYHPD